MIGTFMGIGFLLTYISAAWTKDSDPNSLFGNGLPFALFALGFFALTGIFLFPRTVGLTFTPMSFATPIAFLIALFRNGFTYALFILVMGVGAWLVTFVIGHLRPDAV
jgi:hypothetical protein